jgi:hypothetical protein
LEQCLNGLLETVMICKRKKEKEKEKAIEILSDLVYEECINWVRNWPKGKYGRFLP